jgi:hypothetical protein
MIQDGTARVAVDRNHPADVRPLDPSHAAQIEDATAEIDSSGPLMQSKHPLQATYPPQAQRLRALLQRAALDPAE